MTRRVLVPLLVTALLALGGCAGGTTGGPATPTGGPTASPAASGSVEPGWPTGSVPTAEQLATALVTPADLAGEWAAPSAGQGEGPVAGVIPEDQRSSLPTIELCPAAGPEALAAAKALRWQAFTQLHMTPEDPLDMAAGDRSGHMIFVQEFLLAEDEAAAAATFAALREGMAACMGPQPTDSDGHVVVAQPLALPPLGDEAVGELDTVTEPGPGNGLWRLHNAVVRDGPVLMWTDVVEITLGKGVQPELDQAEIDTILVTEADRIG